MDPSELGLRQVVPGRRLAGGPALEGKQLVQGRFQLRMAFYQALLAGLAGATDHSLHPLLGGLELDVDLGLENGGVGKWGWLHPDGW